SPAVQDAASLDWVPRERLTQAQLADIDATCCGRYVEPALPVLGEAAGTTIINGSGLDADGEGLLRIASDLQVQSGDALVTAQRGSFDTQTRVLELESGIRIRRPGLLLTGGNARVDEGAASSEIRQASYLLHEIAI